MKRLLLTLGLLLLAAAPAGAAVRPHERMRLTRCHHAVAPAHRSFHLIGAMRRVPGTERMAIKVQLQVRLPFQRRWRPYTDFIAPDPLFGTWIPEDLNADRYVFGRTVNNLAGPESPSGRHRPLYFRVRAAFRWYGAHRKVLLTRRTTTASCYQPELRPDLRVLAFTWVTPPRGPAGYVARVRNSGASAADPFAMELAATGQTMRRSVAAPLAPHATARRFFPAATCDPAASLVVDPDGVVDEANERNDRAAVTCP